MGFSYHDKSEIPGDKIKLAIVRSDLVPIPETLEMDLRLDDENRDLLVEGNDVYSGERAFRIIKIDLDRRNAEQGPRLFETLRLTAVMRDLHKLTFVRAQAIWLENTTFTDIYRAAGATLKSAIKGDVRIPLYACPNGDTPTFGIAKLFQEHGGVMRATVAGDLEFLPLPTIFTKPPVLDIPVNTTEAISSGFLERHEIPWTVTLHPDNQFLLGNNSKPRFSRYLHRVTEDVARNMTRVLIQARTARIDLNLALVAGDPARLSDGTMLAILTAVHVYSSGTHGENIDQYTKVWLGALNESAG